MKPFLIPRPKHMVLHQGTAPFQVRAGINIHVSSRKIALIVKMFVDEIWTGLHDADVDEIEYVIAGRTDRDVLGNIQYVVLVNDSRNLGTVLEEVGKVARGSALAPQEYILVAGETGIFMIFESIAGAYNAFWTFFQVLDSSRSEVDSRQKISIPAMMIRDKPDFDSRIVQIHLKTHLHRFSYLMARLRLMANLKINAVLWEWEDKLPFNETLGIRHPLAFNEQETRLLVKYCEELGMESIPLVQTYGHLEFVLKHDRWAHLKENPGAFEVESTMDICALHPETLPLLEKMIDDMVKFHPNSTYLHVGGDEVYTIGTCPRCRKYAEEHGEGDLAKGKGILYVTHMNKIINMVKSRGKIPMIWHDYLLKYPSNLDNLDKDVIIVYWRYGEDLLNENYTEEIDFFKRKGFKVLAANALRSTFQAGIPYYSVRFKNIHDLNRALVHEPSNIVGILATDWAMPMVPMESAVPALLFHAENAWNVNTGEFDDACLREVTRASLKCFFKVDDAAISRHEGLFVEFQEVLTRLRGDLELRKNPEPFRQKLENLSKDLHELMNDAGAGKGVLENLLHGVRLQLLKVDLVALFEKFLLLFDEFADADDIPLANLHDLKTRVHSLNLDFHSYRIDTLDLFGRVAYTGEVGFELSSCFDKVPSFLERVEDQIGTILDLGGSNGNTMQVTAMFEEFMVWFFVGKEKLFHRFL
ncbi:MAG: family 20 glycosylhydrolase [Promethearchaeota archaeon]